MTNISSINTQKLPEMKQPKWYQTEKAAKIAAVATVILAAIGVAASIAMMASGMPLVVISGGVLLGASLNSLLLARHFFKKPCWNDPAYVAKERAKGDKMDYQSLVENYKVRNLYSKEELTEKVVKELDAGTLTYTDLRSKHRNMDFIDTSALTPYFKKEVERLGVFDFFRYEQKLGIIKKEDPWYQEQVKKWAGEAEVYSLVSSYEMGDITRDDLKDYLSQKLQDKGFGIFNKQNVKKVFSNDYLPPGSATKAAKEAVDKLTVKEILDLYGWDIFLTGVLDAREFKERFEQEAGALSFKAILEKYGRDVLETKITSRAFLEARLGSLTFEQEIESQRVK